MALKTKLIESTLKIINDDNIEIFIPKAEARFDFTGSDTIVSISDVRTNKTYSCDVADLEDIDTGLVGNKLAVEQYLCERTGFNPASASGLADLQIELDNLDLATEKLSNKGVANGYAPLDGTAKVPTANLPSYVEEVEEYADLSSFPVTGVVSIIYVALDTNFVYRWTGSTYIEIANKTNFLQVASLPLTGEVDVLYLDQSDKKLYFWDISSYSRPQMSHSELSLDGGTNPHGTTQSDVGLGNADNTSDANKPISTATQTALNLKVDKNTSITGATKTKITYDAKGLVTSGADATTSDIADSTNKRYVTDANLTVIGNTSGTNTGDETTATLGATVNGSTTATIVDADLVPIIQSSVVKKSTWTSIKAFLKTYFDTLYAPAPTWQPPTIPLGACLTSGAVFVANTGCGFYISMSGTADDKIFFNLPIASNNGINYDGSNLKIRVHGRLSSNAGAGETVGLLLNYSFIAVGENAQTKVTNVAQQDVVVTGKLTDLEFDTDLANMTGVANAHKLQVTLTRNSTGAGSDTYAGNFRVDGFEIIKI